jgi:outer membrane immunogenic protein
MRKLLVGLGISTMMFSSCYAADLSPMPTKAPAQYVPASTWDGWYIGGNVGYGSTDFSGNAGGPLNGSTSQNGSGIVGGGQLGVNKTFGAWLIGLETDFQGSGISSGNNQNGIQSDLNYFGTTRVRAGYLWTPSWLVYGTGGAAYGQAQLSTLGNAVQVNVPGIGWAAGAGVEYNIGYNWFVGAEYLHVNLSGLSANIGGLNLSTNANTDIGRFKIDYKFW